MGKKLNYEEVKEVFKEKGYELLSDTYINNHQLLISRDIEGYLYFSSTMTLKSNNIPQKFGNSNPYTIQNIKLWCKNENKLFELTSNTYERSDKKLQWKCLKEECGEIFESSWHEIIVGNGCGYCSGHQVGLSNCLATQRPNLIDEWHPTKNGKLTPYDVTCSSSKDIWWKCLTNNKHEWKTKIRDRTIKNCGCPYCSGLYPTEENNLLIINPELCEEWNYNKNDKNPEEYLPKSSKKVWWKCKECDHEWETVISNRSNGQGCPECNKSKGEKECKRVFISKNFIEIYNNSYNNSLDLINNNHIYFIPQKTFEGLVGLGNGLLSYDFYLPKYNLLIEYQGQYHDGTVSNQTKEEFEIQKEHDKRKRNYAKNNNIQLLEIWYRDFDNIEKLIELTIGVK